jgi:hypothetical protein
MTAKTSVKRRNAFLRAFAQSGNQTLAAEQAGVSRWTIRNLRRADAGFDAQWRGAKAASAERLGGGGCNRPPPEWKQRGGVDLVVQRTAKRPPQVVRAPGRWRWTPRAEGRFLGMLRQCNNLRLACQWAGMTVSSYEAHWRRWPDFRRRVSEARAFAGLSLRARSEARQDGPFEFTAAADAIAPLPTIAEILRLAIRHRRDRARFS